LGRQGFSKGRHNPAVKLTVPEVREIRAAMDAGVGAAHLAVKYGVGETAVRKIGRRETWKDVK
jgi:hypothetical protein